MKRTIHLAMCVVVAVFVVAACSKQMEAKNNPQCDTSVFIQAEISQNAQSSTLQEEVQADEWKPEERATDDVNMEDTGQRCPRADVSLESGDVVLNAAPILLDNPDAILLGEEQALDIVAAYFGTRYSDRIDKANVVLDGNTYVVTIPTKPHEVPPGYLYYGPSYSARVILDAKSGQIYEVRRGR